MINAIICKKRDEQRIIYIWSEKLLCILASLNFGAIRLNVHPEPLTGPLSLLVKECAQFSRVAKIHISNQICRLYNKQEYGMNMKILGWIPEFFLYFLFWSFKKSYQKPKLENT